VSESAARLSETDYPVQDADILHRSHTRRDMALIIARSRVCRFESKGPCEHFPIGASVKPSILNANNRSRVPWPTWLHDSSQLKHRRYWWGFVDIPSQVRLRTFAAHLVNRDTFRKHIQSATPCNSLSSLESSKIKSIKSPPQIILSSEADASVSVERAATLMVFPSEKRPPRRA
jgi:hypothetical protein